MQFARYKDFDRAVQELWKKGGVYQKAAERVLSALGKAAAGLNPLQGLGVTNHGETRVPHCVKYDLPGACRLITVQDGPYCIFVFCGDHAACDHWLETNRGFTPVVDSDLVIRVTYVSSATEARPRVAGVVGRSLGLLLERLNDSMTDALIANLPRSVARSIEQLDGSTSEAELWTALSQVTDAEQRRMLHDVLSLLRQDKLREAVKRAELFTGAAALPRDLPEELLPEVVDSDVIRRIDPKSASYSEAIRRFIRTARYRDWMLFMHPDQERIVEEDFDGPAKLVGVSGSGKTCVVVQRAVRLARRYPDERILVVTLNRVLANLICQLVETVGTEDEVRRISVVPFFSLCRSLLSEFEPRADKHYDEVTWKINEHVDEIWQEYYRCETNNPDAKALEPVHDTLLARGWNPEKYLREEIDWLRSALPSGDRSPYLDMQRTGRTVPLTGPMRQSILEGAAGWDAKMRDVGVVDGLGIAQALSKHLPSLSPRYRCVLIDEAQDFGNLELQIIVPLVSDGENSLFLCGDAAQAVTSKYQSLSALGIRIPPQRSRRLSLNYRNSRDVLQASYAVLSQNITEEMMDREDFEILDPEFSAFSATTPLVLGCDNLSREIGFARRYAADLAMEKAGAKICLAICGYTLFELVKFGKTISLPVLDGTSDIESGTVFLSDLEQTKGFEFDCVIILNCASGELPNRAAPESERFRDLARLYVAMTRAKTDLVLSWSAAPSPFLQGLGNHFLFAHWADYLEFAEIEEVGAPQRLETHREYGLHRRSWTTMSGAEFLHHEASRGLSPELIAKLRELVDGVGLISRGLPKRWRTMGDAARDYSRIPPSRREWGSETGKQFQDLVSKLV